MALPGARSRLVGRGGLMAAGVAAGAVRSDLETGDVVLAMSGLLRLDAAGDWRSQAGRLIGLLMDGLTTGAAGPSPRAGAAQG